jgi:solute carrier family 25 S-adenosylmethionine transporter 26
MPTHDYARQPADYPLQSHRSLKAACLVRVPTEVIKTRSQTSSYGTLANTSLATAKLVWKADGLRGFYRGFGTTVMREVIPLLALAAG